MRTQVNLKQSYTAHAVVPVGRVTISSSVLQFWDLGGQKDLRSLWPKYYEDCHAVCFVIDSTDTSPYRAETSWQIFDEICSDKRVHGVPILVLVNKTDQETEGKASLESIKEVFTKYVDKLNLSEAAVMPISALKG